ncbi:MAG: hypothetical protein AAGI53_05470 [Planctomycetota bacterium]
MKLCDISLVTACLVASSAAQQLPVHYVAQESVSSIYNNMSVTALVEAATFYEIDDHVISWNQYRFWPISGGRSAGFQPMGPNFDNGPLNGRQELFNRLAADPRYQVIIDVSTGNTISTYNGTIVFDIEYPRIGRLFQDAGGTSGNPCDTAPTQQELANLKGRLDRCLELYREYFPFASMGLYGAPIPNAQGVNNNNMYSLLGVPGGAASSCKADPSKPLFNAIDEGLFDGFDVIVPVLYPRVKTGCDLTNPGNYTNNGKSYKTAQLGLEIAKDVQSRVNTRPTANGLSVLPFLAFEFQGGGCSVPSLLAVDPDLSLTAGPKAELLHGTVPATVIASASDGLSVGTRTGHQFLSDGTWDTDFSDNVVGYAYWEAGPSDPMDPTTGASYSDWLSHLDDAMDLACRKADVDDDGDVDSDDTLEYLNLLATAFTDLRHLDQDGNGLVEPADYQALLDNITDCTGTAVPVSP